MKRNIGIIGIGDFGIEHVKVFKENNKAHVVTVCARTEEKVKKVARDFNIPNWETDAQKVFENPEIDAVVIATTEKTHYEFTKKAVNNGKHVLLEKPVCLDLEEGQKLVELSKTTDKVILPGHILRFDASYAKVKNMVSSGEVGEILSIKAKRNVPCERFSLHSRTHPVFMALAHDIDILLWLTQAFPKKVYALQKRVNLNNKTPNIFFGLMEMDNGVLCQLETQWVLPDEYGKYLDVELELMTTTGNIKLKYPGDNLTLMNNGNLSYPDVTLWPEVHGTTTGSLANEVNHFLDLINGTTQKPVITVKEAVQGIKVGQLLIKSASEGKEICVQEEEK